MWGLTDPLGCPREFIGLRSVRLQKRGKVDKKKREGTRTARESEEDGETVLERRVMREVEVKIAHGKNRKGTREQKRVRVKKMRG